MFLLALPFLFLAPLFPLLASALPNITALRIGANNCSAYPNSFPSAGDNADAFIFRPFLSDNPALNNLPTAFINSTLYVFPNSSESAVFCCDYGGRVLDPFGVQALLISNDDGELGYWEKGKGVQPEGYEILIDGVKQAGRYLGLGNVTMWGFRRVEGKEDWAMRLLGNGTVKRDGEVGGFLRISAPPIPAT